MTEDSAIETVGDVDVDVRQITTRVRPGRISDSYTRAIIAGMLVALFVVTNLATLGLVVWDQAHGLDWQPIREVSELLLPTQGALIGSAVGFYFADSRRDS